MSYYRIPYWRSDRDYFRRDDAEHAAHSEAIAIQETINRRIAASSATGDASYSVMVTRKEIA